MREKLSHSTGFLIADFAYGIKSLIKKNYQSVFLSMKRLSGETLSSRKFSYAIRELIIIASLFNIFHTL